MSKIFKISDERIKEMYLNGCSLNDIAKIAQDTKGLMPLRKRLHELGISTKVSMKKYGNKISASCRKYKFNEHIFDFIDTQDKAYWLGLLMADGYNNEKKHYVSLRLKSEDLEILEKYKSFLSTDIPIYIFNRITSVNKLHKTYNDLSVSSKIYSNRLAELGCVQNKTLILKFPDIPENLYSHFIRGYFDGDGCISIGNRKNRKCKSYQLTIVGLESFLLKIQDILVSNIGISMLPLKERRKNSSIKTLQYSGRRNLIKILDYLYNNANTFLKRKHDLYINCISAE